MKKRILIDQDGVLADFEQGVNLAWQRKFGESLPLTAPRRHFYLADDLPHLKNELYEIYSEPNFFRDLPPIEGALDALDWLICQGYEVRICTAPISAYRNCVAEKFMWVERHLGFEWTKRIILAKDKTWVRGDVLIDDKPEVTGSLPAVWAHWLYDQPYNQHVNKPKVCWVNTDDWQRLLQTL